MSVLLHCFPGRLKQDSDTSHALSHPYLSLAPFRLSFSLLRASERLSTIFFNSLPRSHTLIIPVTPSRSTRKTLNPTFPRETDAPEGDLCCPSDVHSGYKHPQSLPSVEHEPLYIYGFYLQSLTGAQLSTDISDKVIFLQKGQQIHLSLIILQIPPLLAFIKYFCTLDLAVC